jgi:hypothetical protein
VRERDELGQREKPGRIVKISQIEIVIQIHRCFAGWFSRSRERPRGRSRGTRLNILQA